MKQQITEKAFDELPVLNRLFLALWRERKGLSSTKEYSFGELTELALALTSDLQFDTPAERTTFNNGLHYEEFNLSWDGSDPTEALWYELNEKLRRRIVQYLVVEAGK